MIGWENARTLLSKDYRCGHCGHSLVSNLGFLGLGQHANGQPLAQHFLYICHFCSKPTYFSPLRDQVPGCQFGEKVNHIEPKEVEDLYQEARNCISVNAFTGSVLCARKLLMNIAVSKGASEGLKFIEYVTYLSDKGYVPPNGKDWVDHIRSKGNEATHEITVMNREDAEDLITFAGALLRFIYEYPGMLVERKKKPKS